jgi:2-Cys peroxiredoxin 5
MFTRRAFATTGAVKRLLQAPSHSARKFHASAPAFVKVGDAIPNVDLVEDSPGNKVSIAYELRGKGVIIGVPAAFSKIVSPKTPSFMELIFFKAQHAQQLTSRDI